MSKRKKQRRRKAHLVEFVGLPTSGKTTIYKQIEADENLLSKYLIITPNTFSKLSTSTIYLNLPILILSNLRNIVFITYFCLVSCKWNRFNFYIYKHLIKMLLLTSFYKRRKHDFLLRECLIHFLTVLTFKDKIEKESVMETFLLKMEKQYAVFVYVDISEGDFYNRFIKRIKKDKKNYVNTLSKKQRSQFFENAYSNHLVLKKIVHKKIQTPSIVLDGTKPPEENAVIAARFIEKHVG